MSPRADQQAHADPELTATVFEPIAYLEWIAGRPEAADHDLGSSDLRRAGDGRVVPPALADREDPPPGTTLESQVATVYDADPTDVHVTAGASHANLLAAMAACAASDDPHVLVESPGYEPQAATPAGFGASVDRFSRAPGGRLDPGRLRDALTPETDLVVCTNRHNPTGALADRETLAAAAEAVGEVDATLLVDEVYAPYVLEARSGDGSAFGGVTAAGLPNTVVASSLTKFHGLGGLRIGWLVGEGAFVERLDRVAWHLPVVADPSRALARRTLHHADALAERSRERLAANHELLSEFLAGRTDVVGDVPAGCPYGLVWHADVDGDVLSAAAWEAGVLVVPGRFFGVRGAVRVAAGHDAETTAAALAAFGRVLDGAETAGV
ncbi:pyridoxal phosphate-dependent aminotransferase [Halomarina ordinaria]|uniref:Aminotransferase n=1 Tax=Halomarina ordinaria TaxID=3033939 RepID=A0ABD5UE76_9EURY|nr:pyridoxal phosphate-dependent aminotransferase [Halomarina sp. PSRA2]